MKGEEAEEEFATQYGKLKDTKPQSSRAKWTVSWIMIFAASKAIEFIFGKLTNGYSQGLSLSFKIAATANAISTVAVIIIIVSLLFGMIHAFRRSKESDEV